MTRTTKHGIQQLAILITTYIRLMPQGMYIKQINKFMTMAINSVTVSEMYLFLPSFLLIYDLIYQAITKNVNIHII